MTDDPQSPKRLRVAAYCRYSSHVQDDGYSIPKQHDATLAESRREEAQWDITWYDEPAHSAFHDSAAKRPVFSQMMRDVQAGQIDLVVVWKINRFARHVETAMRAWDDIKRAGASFYSINEKADMRTPQGWLFHTMQAMLAQYFSEELGVEVREGFLQRAKTGLHLAHPPYGYRIQNVLNGAKLPFEYDLPAEEVSGDPDTRMDTHPGDFAGLKQLQQYLLMGMTNEEAAAAMNRLGTWQVGGVGVKDGPRPFTADSVARIRTNVYYRPFTPNDDHGTVTMHGQEYRGQHLAACTWDEWRTMQEIARGRRRGRNLSGRMVRSEPFAAEFRGLLCCAECGSRLYVDRVKTYYGSQKAGQAREELVERYFCSARDRGVACASARKFIYASEMRQQWMAWLRAHPLPPEFEELIKQYVLWIAKHQREAAGQGRGGQDLKRVITEKQLWEKRLANATTAFTAAAIDEREWRHLRKEAEKKIKDLNHAWRGAEQLTIRFMDAARQVRQWSGAWEVMSTQERQMAAQLMVPERGIRVEVLGGDRGRYHRYQTAADRPPSGRLVEVTLRDPFRDLLAVVSGGLVSEVAG